ncbi:amine oxidase [Blastococcus sp. CT_GayMR16]|nr:amine oxidase [Blastococcus sp. CT_GayMR16]
MAGLTTAWELSSGDWRERLDSICVYQRGWRLGGKGASSRGPHGRIEEHGLHVLLGYYDATFRLLREVYGELDRDRTDPGCPVRTWQQAVTPTGDVGLADRDGDSWTSFVTRFSGNDAVPGEPGAEDRTLTPVDVATRGLGLLADFLRSAALPRERGRIFLSTSPVPGPGRSELAPLLRGASLAALAALLEGLERTSRLAAGGLREIPLAQSLAAALRTSRDDVRAALTADPALRRTWQLVDLVVSCLQGMAADGLLAGNGYDRIDHLDFREWLAGHGAAAETLDSPVVRGMYDLTFAYVGGDRARPRFAAGLGLSLAGRMLFDFKGSLFWRMQAGMGEIVFAPLYQALVRRGVEFRFFRRLDRLRLGPARSVASIELTRQSDLAPGRSRYDPLIRVGGLPCWPDRPLVDQLAEDPGDRLESHPGPMEGAGTETLRAGEDFDVAVLAVSVGMVPHVAAELVAADPAWQTMVDRVATVGTRSAQLWLDASERELGWHGPPGVTLSGFGDTFDTWASMSHLLPREEWPSPGAPRSIAYLCGALPDGDTETGDETVRTTLTQFLDGEVAALWPGFRWELLWDAAGRAGPERLHAQYVRANVDPSDRYVQSLPGSGRHRLAPGRTGFVNLAVAGDWTACGLDAGCIEAAARSGVLAARAVLSGAVGRPASRGTAA